MKTILLSLCACWMASPTMAGDSQWLTSLPQAVAKARAENKTILLDFTGSDWCGWCKKLNAETFSKSEFNEYAKTHLVLVELDFPRNQPQSDELKQANAALKEKYSVSGFPTLVALSPDETVLWKQTGYLKGGPAALIAKFGSEDSKPVAAAPAPVPAIYPQPRPRSPGDEPRLQGIFWSSSHPSALLEGTTCEVGDSVKGMHVLKIARDKVTVEWKGATHELTMK